MSGPRPTRPTTTRRRWPGLWIAATLTVIVTLTWLLLTALRLDVWSVDAGLVLGRELIRAGGVVVLGLLIALVLLPDIEHGGAVPAEDDRKLRAGVVGGAWTWLVGAVIELALRYASATGAAARGLNDAMWIGGFALGDRHGALYFTHALLVLLLVALVTRPVRSRVAVVRALLVAGLATATLPLTGHAAALPPAAVLATSVHVVASVLWVGGLIGVTTATWIIGRMGRAAGPTVLRCGAAVLAVTPGVRDPVPVLRQPEEIRIGPGGDLVVPLSVLAEAGLSPGGAVVAYSDGDGRVVLRRADDALADLLRFGTLT